MNIHASVAVSFFAKKIVFGKPSDVDYYNWSKKLVWILLVVSKEVRRRESEMIEESLVLGLKGASARCHWRYHFVFCNAFRSLPNSTERMEEHWEPRLVVMHHEEIEVGHPIHHLIHWDQLKIRHRWPEDPNWYPCSAHLNGRVKRLRDLLLPRHPYP